MNLKTGNSQNRFVCYAVSSVYCQAILSLGTGNRKPLISPLKSSKHDKKGNGVN